MNLWIVDFSESSEPMRVCSKSRSTDVFFWLITVQDFLVCPKSYPELLSRNEHPAFSKGIFSGGMGNAR
jgi:hypothetical protein